MNESRPFISFILPALNEERNIENAINSINQGDLSFPYEIIVVDHCSVDNTASIASKLSANVVGKIGGTIASVRNLGVEKSKGQILIFLDSDVTLTSQWFAHIAKVVDELLIDPYLITGSHCNAPDHGGWIEHCWFNNYVSETNATNLGTGHMIMTQKLFEKVGGFNEFLETGEDYDMCMRVAELGGSVINNPALRVIHNDYPSNLWQFILRESWHGKGDVSSLKQLLASKVAVATLVFAVLHLAWILTLLNQDLPTITRSLPLIGIITILVLSSFKKFHHCSILTILKNSVIFYFYYLGRLISFFPFKRPTSKQ